MSVEIPALPKHCWPVNWAADPESQTLDPVVKDHAEALAVASLRSLTGWRVGGCPITVTPRRVHTAGRTWVAATDGHIAHFYPHLRGGVWVNGGPCAGQCPAMDRVPLPGPVWGVQSVTIDGGVLPTSAYHVEGEDLVRDDGGSWPLCSTAWTVVYLNAAPVDGLGAWIAGILASEFGKALQGGTCRLPSGTTAVTRAGVSIELAASTFDGGLTGIREVDAWVRQWNPHHLDSAVVVSSPDYSSTSQRTWG